MKPMPLLPNCKAFSEIAHQGALPRTMREMTEGLLNRPGWVVIVEEAIDALDRYCSRDQQRCRLKSASVREGRLYLEIVNPNEPSRGLTEAAKAVSAEVCELCGGRGNPVGDGRRLLGCRCEGCRAAGMERFERKWQGPPGEQVCLATSSFRAGEVDSGSAKGRDPVCGGFSSRWGMEYRDDLALLMSGRDDERAMRPWTSNPGWAGLVRALFTTLQAERVGGESDADPALPRLPFMKEKYGQLRIDFDLYSDYQLSVGWFFEELSGRICMHCGMPGKCRDREWVRTECDPCAAITEKMGRSRF